MSRFSKKIVASAQPHLEPGEEVHGAFAAQDAKIFRAQNRYSTVVATDRRILVFDSGTFSQTKTKTLLGELPRSTKLGPTSGLWHEISFQDQTLYVNRRHHKQVTAIDDAGPTATAG